MKTLHTHNEEMEKKFNEEFTFEGTGDWIDEDKLNGHNIKNFIANSHKQLYIKIAEGELARLETQLMKESPLHDAHQFYQVKDYNSAIQQQIIYWNNILQELNK